MRKTILALLAAALVASAGSLLYSAGDAFGGVVSCVGTPGTLPGTTVNANVTVPSGSWCDIEGQTINGNINVQPGGGLVVRDSTVNGNINAGSPGSFAGAPCGPTPFSFIIGSSHITGTTNVHGASGAVTIGNGCGRPTFDNNVYANNNSGPVTVSAPAIHGNLYVQGNTGPTPTVALNHVSNIIYCSPATGAGNTAKTIYGTCTF